ncbi:MAG TPA: CDP-alcohol phosphatidyltransferase family protein [bacterium]|nr:CDP-alcohol phosphatidyltransferase family protein [bacterium]HQI47607.1 CDP-alcohol phosphatidyltransferase family protein [bacterium]HQJ64384.1 CDP-alcohol phosphatidyltransferase family protein [bacterium]HQJ65496.1 CDP-alcohol phosphatidyltransferase family protein [bacterium]
MIKEFIDMPRLERWIGKAFAFLSPNSWTTLSLLLALAAYGAVVLGSPVSGALLFTLSGFMDLVDGKVARHTRHATGLGAFWDGTVDRFVDALMILCLFRLDFPPAILPMEILLFLLLFCTLLPPFIVAYANHRGAVPDPTEKVVWRFALRIEYLVFFIAAILVNPFSAAWSLGLVYAALALMAATVVQSIVLVFIKSRDYA